MSVVDVVSSNIARVAYDDVESKLYVEFKSGGVWVYIGVPYEVCLEMVGAPSVGVFFHRNVRSKYAAHSVPSIPEVLL